MDPTSSQRPGATRPGRAVDRLALLRHAVVVGVRVWRRRPGAALVAVLSLGVAIGVLVAVLDLLATLYWRPPFPTEADGLFRVVEARDSEGSAGLGFSLDAWSEIRASTTGLDDIAAERVAWVWAPRLDGAGSSAELDGGIVTANYFEVLGIRPVVGRLFVEGEDDAPDAQRTAVLGHRLWRQRFGADARVVGRQLELDGLPFTVVGVAAAEFSGASPGEARDLWLPANATEPSAPSHLASAADPLAAALGSFELVGRTSPGTTLESVGAELDTWMARLADPGAHGDEPGAERTRLEAVPLRGASIARRELVGRTPALAGAAALGLWLLACFNAAGLVSVNHRERQREVETRLALGAARGALLRQLFVESLVLVALGGLLGALTAYGARKALQHAHEYRLPGLELHGDLGSLAAGILFAAGAACLAGLVPAWLASRIALAPARTAARWGLRPARRLAPGGSLVVAQVALALSLVSAAAVMLRSVEALLESDGNQPSDVLHYRLRPSRVGHDATAAARYQERLLERVASVPSVSAVALARVGPDRGWCCEVEVSLSPHGDGTGEDSGSDTMEREPLGVDSNHVTPEYLRTLGIPLLRGRDFQPADGPQSPAVAIVNLALAERLWPGVDPLGRTLQASGRAYQVVGVVPNLLPARPGEGPVPYLLLALRQHELVDVRLYARVAGDTPRVRRELRETIVGIDPAVHMGQEGTLRERTLLQHAEERWLADVLRVCASLALALGTLGLYAQAALLAQRRVPEIGLRLALGATSRQVLAVVMAQGLGLVTAGLALGLFVVGAQGRLLRAYAHGVSPADPALVVAGTLLVLAVGTLATYLPARRAARVDPWTVLRN